MKFKDVKIGEEFDHVPINPSYRWRKINDQNGDVVVVITGGFPVGARSSWGPDTEVFNVGASAIID